MEFRETAIKAYSASLLGGALYYGLLLALQYQDIYETWHHWVSYAPQKIDYFYLALFYSVVVVTPIILAISGVQLGRRGHINIFLSVALACLLLLSSLVGKVILLAGMFIYAYVWFSSKPAT